MAFDQEKIQELYPEAKMYPAMLINKGTETLLKTACGSGNYFGQLKKDGYWYQFEKHQNSTYLFSRSASTVTKLQAEKSANVPHIIEALGDLPAETILIGEVYYPNGTSKNVTSIMGCLAKKAVERQENEYGFIHYYIHDILMYNGINFIEHKTSNWDRYQILSKIFKLHGLDKYVFMELAEAWEDDLYSRVGDALDSGEEGMVIKAKDGVYEPGKRPAANIKAKKVDFADVIICGFEEPTKEYYGKGLESWDYWIRTSDEMRMQGKFYGKDGYTAVTKPYYYKWMNSRIKIGVYDNNSKLINIGTIHSGISDELKADMSAAPDKYLNKVCAIQMMEVDKKEKTIRHGFFKHMRPDKDACTCLVQDVFGQE